MYDVTDHKEPITGLLLEPFPQQPSSSEIKYFIMATTPKRIYQFIGTVSKGDTPQFLAMFAHYETVKGESSPSPLTKVMVMTACLPPVQFLEIPGNLKDSQLHMWPSQPDRIPQAFAWLTGTSSLTSVTDLSDGHAALCRCGHPLWFLGVWGPPAGGVSVSGEDAHPIRRKGRATRGGLATCRHVPQPVPLSLAVPR